MRPLADAAARNRIRSDLETTFVVEAAAGTGKTTELVARIVSLIRSGRTTLDRILAVTFTDLAAGEMKLRLRGELEAARAGAGAEEQRRLALALSRLEVAAIGTIHSFCADLLRERPVEAQVDPLFELPAEEDQERLFGQAFDEWFQRTVSDPGEGVRRLLRRKVRPAETSPRELLRKAAWDVCEHRDFAAPWRREPFDRKASLQRVLDKLASVGELAAQAQQPDDWIAQSLAEIGRFVSEVQRREAARGRDEDGIEGELYEFARRKHWGWNGGGKRFSREQKASAIALRDAAKQELDAFLEASGADLAACLREELRSLCAAYEDAKRRAGSLDFLDLLLRARDLVRGDPTIRRELQERFTHVLVDEFQDTDPLQAEILLLIAADDPVVTDFRRARPVEGKLFVVGDPKQSIYRFRRADIALYQEVKTALLRGGAELLHLSTSFRSVPAIQKAVNVSFAPRMQGGTQASYVALDAFRDDPADRPSVVALPAPRIYGRRGIANDRITESYAEAVGAFVEWLVRHSGWRVSERDKTEPVPIEARHVCLLFRRMRGWNGTDLTRPYVRALEARRVPHVLFGGRSFHDREEVLAMRAAAAAIEWPDDELAVFAALRGPMFALGDDALLLFHERQGRLHPMRKLEGATLSAAEQDVAQALGVLGELHLERNRRPVAETLMRLLDATRAHAGFAIWPAGEQALGNVLRVLELARRFESPGATSFRAFVERLSAEAERGEGAEAPVVEEGAEGVRITTVHKAKGLEFPVVVLCDPCARAAPRNPTRLVDPARRLWAMPLAGCAPAELLAEAPALIERDREEIVRIAYVAATRARDVLVVPALGDAELSGWLEPLNAALMPDAAHRREPRSAPACPAFGQETVLDRPEGLSGALSVSPGLHHPAPEGPEVVWWDPRLLEGGGDAEGGLRSNDLLIEDSASGPASDAHRAWMTRRKMAVEGGSVPSLRVETATARAISSRHIEGVPVEFAAIDGRERNRPRGKRFGTLVHAILAEVRLDASLDEVTKMAAAQGRRVGAPREEIAAAAMVAAAALEHPLLRRAAASSDLRREEPVAHRLADGSFVEGAVDLAFRDGDEWIVVDFKTDARPEIQTEYAAQLRLYCVVISAASGLPARGAILAV